MNHQITVYNQLFWFRSITVRKSAVNSSSVFLQQLMYRNTRRAAVPRKRRLPNTANCSIWRHLVGVSQKDRWGSHTSGSVNAKSFTRFTCMYVDSGTGENHRTINILWGKHAESKIRCKQGSRDNIFSALENNHYSLYTLNWQSGSPATPVSVWRNQINDKTSSIQNDRLHFKTGHTPEQRFEREVESSNRKINNPTPKGQFQNKTNKIFIYIHCFHILNERKGKRT